MRKTKTMKNITQGNGDVSSPGLKRRYELLLRMTKKNENGCLIWQGAQVWTGYGHAMILGVQWRVHRFIAYYNLPSNEDRIAFLKSGRVVRHMCNDTSCINPEHLIIGTQDENIQDIIANGSLRGINNPRAKLSDDDVRQIRLEYQNGATIKTLSQQYNIGRTAIHDIVYNIHWSHVQ